LYQECPWAYKGGANPMFTRRRNAQRGVDKLGISEVVTMKREKWVK
jgi:hypothetical protein